MPNAARILIVGIAAMTFVACHKAETNEAALANSDLSVDGNLTSSRIPSNAEIETLPPDESSVTSSGELNSGDDTPDVNDLGNAH